MIPLCPAKQNQVGSGRAGGAGARSRGFVLIAVIMAMTLLSIFALGGAAMMATRSHMSVQSKRTAEGRAVAYGAAQYVLAQISSVVDWGTLSPLNNIALGGQTFSVAYSNKSKNSVEAAITVTGGSDQAIVRRTESVSFRRTLAPAFRFGLYRANKSKDIRRLDIEGQSNINGNLYTGGNVQIKKPGSVSNGFVYASAGSSVTGDGTYYPITVIDPQPAFPAFNSASYDLLIAGYGTSIQTAYNNRPADNAANDVTVNTTVTVTGVTVKARDYIIDGGTLNLKGGTIHCRDFITRGNGPKVLGYGKIVAWRNILLQSNSGTTTLTPDNGGNIELMSARNIVFNPAGLAARKLQANRSGENKVIFYSQNSVSSNDRIFFAGSNCVLRHALIMADRRIIFDAGAQALEDSILLVRRLVSANTGNNLIMVDRSSVVDGSLISLSERDINLWIQGSSKITGLVYSRGNAANGSVVLKNCTIQGSVIANEFRENLNTVSEDRRITGLSLEWKLEYLPDQIPEGFETMAVKLPGGWSD